MTVLECKFILATIARRYPLGREWYSLISPQFGREDNVKKQFKTLFNELLYVFYDEIADDLDANISARIAEYVL